MRSATRAVVVLNFNTSSESRVVRVTRGFGPAMVLTRSSATGTRALMPKTPVAAVVCWKATPVTAAENASKVPTFALSLEKGSSVWVIWNFATRVGGVSCWDMLQANHAVPAMQAHTPARRRIPFHAMIPAIR